MNAVAYAPAILKAVMTAEERFQQIEASLAASASVLHTLVASQARTQETLSTLTESVSRYIDAADARMRRIEENLDGLIRAITADHTNGKS